MPASPRSVLLGTPLWGRNGGVAAHVQASARLLAEQGLQVSVVAAKVDPELHVPGVTVHHSMELFKRHVPIDARLGAAASASPDVVHLHQLDDPDMVAALQCKAPVVVSAHGYTACTAGVHYFRPGQECARPHGPGCIPNLALRGCAHVRNPQPLPASYRQTTGALAALRGADLAVAYSNAVERHLEVNGVTRRAVIPLFVTLSPLPPRGPHLTQGPHEPHPPYELHDPQNRANDRTARRVVFAGRVVKPKGLDVLIRAMRAVDAELAVCGDGIQLAAMRRLAQRVGMEQRVHFRGWLNPDQLARELADASIVAIPSLWPEPFGLVGIEALAAGRPVVASLTGGIPDWLQDGVTGVGVRPGDVQGLAQALDALLADPERQQAIGVAGREMVTARFSPERHVEALLEAYRAACASWEEPTRVNANRSRQAGN
ncbi:MAG TPA: glycosyltransferase [Solirubrobacteraceae bacterium]|jgi:glycosyltransferase involved in cell wall biosynthesis|nr:glycosyltransferase [Solirubrobacteraceae bacterium]